MTRPPEQRRSADASRIGVIDIGTNSVKVVVAGRDLEPAYFDRRTTRLGKGMSGGREVRREALDATAATVRGFTRAAHCNGARQVFAFATWAMRRAGDATRVLSTLEARTGLEIRVLSGREEARFAYLSARAHLDRPRLWTLMCDVGGGSTELVLARSGRVVATTSRPLGALHLTERYIDSNPVDTGQFERLTRHVREVVERWMCSRDPVAPSRLDLVASGGSVTTLAAMLAGGKGIETTVRLGALRTMLERCLALTIAERRRIPGLPADRADIIPAGMAVVLAVMRAAGKRTLRVNDGGVREGALIHLLRNNLEW
jgi:exopolyphosphatase/guanosine-5'-triphosphate,3'-diphosphate pyrophosphatase